MDVRSMEDVAPVIEHNGTTPVWWLVPPGEMQAATEGGFLELGQRVDRRGGRDGRTRTRTRPTSTTTSSPGAAS